MRTYIKKSAVILLCLALALSLTACKNPKREISILLLFGLELYPLIVNKNNYHAILKNGIRSSGISIEILLPVFCGMPSSA